MCKVIRHFCDAKVRSGSRFTPYSSPTLKREDDGPAITPNWLERRRRIMMKSGGLEI